jgi:regulator of RNase E activity RraA
MIVSASSVSDALDALGIAGQCAGVRPLRAGLRVFGRAFTLQFGAHEGADDSVGDFIDDVPAGAVIVASNGGRTDCSVWGELLTYAALRRAVAGTVIDGVCRDSSIIRELGYPLFSCGAFMRTGKDRVALKAVNATVCIGGIDVAPGDLVVGDDDGVVVIPRAVEHRVIEAATGIEVAEARIREAIAAGSRLDVARARHGYFALQRGKRS